MEESSRYYVCRLGVALEQRLMCGSALMRTLEVGELFEVVEGPSSHTSEAPSRMRGRNLSDGTEGWFNGPSEVVSPWQPLCRCKQSIAVTEHLELSGSKTLRELETGEAVEALDTPRLEKSSGLLRSRVRC